MAATAAVGTYPTGMHSHSQTVFYLDFFLTFTVIYYFKKILMTVIIYEPFG